VIKEYISQKNTSYFKLNKHPIKKESAFQILFRSPLLLTAVWFGLQLLICTVTALTRSYRLSLGWKESFMTLRVVGGWGRGRKVISAKAREILILGTSLGFFNCRLQ
jgi:hypothetical protein